MQSMFLAIVLTVGANERGMSDLPPNAQMGAHQDGVPEMPGPYRYDPPRDPQDTDTIPQAFFKYCGAWFQPMPQTCYGPHFGCYPGNNRDIHRYPAFHGYYYRQAYNYRPLYEYPWQADPHEPLPLEINNNEQPSAVQWQPKERVEVIGKPSASLPLPHDQK